MIITCEGCSKTDDMSDWATQNPRYHNWRRVDRYNIFTGYYCDGCYDDPVKYTFRKDDYYDPGYAGERLEENY
jgi:hypothetical protein